MRILCSLAILSTLLSTLVACSNKAIYTGLQESGRNECRQLPQEQYEQCMADYEKSYDEYQREREEALK